MSGFEWPINLAETVRSPRVPKSVRAWANRLPELVEDVARRWSLELGRPYQPGGTASWVAPARRGNERLVLKIGWPHSEAEHESDGLRAWAGAGAVLLVDSMRIGATTALLLERCEPGTTLASAATPAEQDRIVAQLLRRMWIRPSTGHPFRTLTELCDSWADDFEASQVARKGSNVASLLDTGLVTAGLQLWRELPRTAPRSVLLCTDLHAENVLAAAREPWLAIDPKPYVGDPTYDPLQHMLNHPDRIRACPVQFVRRMAGLLDLEAARLRLWLFARCVVETANGADLLDAIPALAP